MQRATTKNIATKEGYANPAFFTVVDAKNFSGAACEKTVTSHRLLIRYRRAYYSDRRAVLRYQFLCCKNEAAHRGGLSFPLLKLLTKAIPSNRFIQRRDSSFSRL